jgi:crotonobetainyl-CoA:carnitine CoA-transferase CaiB-like acyl-CoA transferase
MSGPLQGVRILDLTTVIMGPYATQILGDLGAEIIKVESPLGDNMRHVGPMKNPGMGHIFLNANRNKRSIVLDLKQSAARDAVLRLAANCDVLVYNVRPQAMARLGLSYAEVQAVNPRIIYIGAVGFGEDGPYAGMPAYDDLIQGAAAIPSLMLKAGADVPRYTPITLADRSVGQQVAVAVSAALYSRTVSGQGQRIEIPMFENMVQFVLGDHLAGLSFEPAIGSTGYDRLLAEHRRPYATLDGYVCALIYNDKQWQSFFRVIERPEMFADARFSNHTSRAENIGEVYAFVAEIIAGRTTAEWLTVLAQADIPSMPLHTVESLIDDPHLKATGFFRSVEHPSEGRLRVMAPPGTWSGTPPAIRLHAPRLGEQTIEILREAGYDAAAIDALLATCAAVAAPVLTTV